MDKLKNSKDRMEGKAKETMGKAFDNDKMEFGGKLKIIKSELGDKMEDIKESIYEGANDMIDKMKGDRKNGMK